PYALARVEEDFIIPENVQSLIWEDLVPSLLTSAVLPRWWGVTGNEMHAVSLYQRAGEELLTAAMGDEKLRQNLIEILADRMLPQRSERVREALRDHRPEETLSLVMPAETAYLAAEFQQRFPEDHDHWGSAGKELEN